MRNAPALDVDGAPGGDQITALRPPVRGLAVDGVAPVHGHDGLDPSSAVIRDAKRVVRAKLAQHICLAPVHVRACGDTVDEVADSCAASPFPGSRPLRDRAAGYELTVLEESNQLR